GVAMRNGQGFAGGILMVEVSRFERPLTRQIIVPQDLKREIPFLNPGGLERIAERLTRITRGQRWLARDWFRELENLPLPLAVIRKPRLEYTIGVGDRAHGSRGKVTIGLPARDRMRSLDGFITVDHGISDIDPQPSYVLKDGTKCKVLTRRPNWDAAFVSYEKRIVFPLKCQSIMRDHAPGRG